MDFLSGKQQETWIAMLLAMLVKTIATQPGGKIRGFGARYELGLVLLHGVEIGSIHGNRTRTSFQEFAARHCIDQLAITAIGAAWFKLGILRQEVLLKRLRGQ